jgi:hypothetical protein
VSRYSLALFGVTFSHPHRRAALLAAHAFTASILGPPSTYLSRSVYYGSFVLSVPLLVVIVVLFVAWHAASCLSTLSAPSTVIVVQRLLLLARTLGVFSRCLFLRTDCAAIPSSFGAYSIHQEICSPLVTFSLPEFPNSTYVILEFPHVQLTSPIWPLIIATARRAARPTARSRPW